MTTTMNAGTTQKDNSEIYTLDELIKRRASQLEDAPLLGYPKTGFTDYEEHSAASIDKYVDAAVVVLQQRGLPVVVSVPQTKCTILLLTYPGRYPRESPCRRPPRALQFGIHHHDLGLE
jgi:hypothetical protein